MPNASRRLVDLYLPHLLAAMDEFEINTPLRQAAFLGQLAEESGEFHYMREIWGPTAAQRKYEGREDLGNTEPGDGKRFMGRGAIQLTGRANYEKYGDILGIDLVNNPTQAEKPEVAFRLAGAFWDTHNLNKLADTGNFKAITKAINGGYTHLKERTEFYERAKKVLAQKSDDSGPTEMKPLTLESQVQTTSPTGDTTAPAAPKADNPIPQDVVIQPTTPEDTTSKKSFRTIVGGAVAAAGAWISANVGEAFGYLKNLDVNQFLKWLVIVGGVLLALYLLRQIVKMAITQAGAVLYNLKSMQYHADPSTNNVKLASPAPREGEG